MRKKVKNMRNNSKLRDEKSELLYKSKNYKKVQIIRKKKSKS